MKQELLDLAALTVVHNGERKSDDEQFQWHRTAGVLTDHPKMTAVCPF